jgi:succinate dehydrogenase hydrophobic anchor subunit
VSEANRPAPGGAREAGAQANRKALRSNREITEARRGGVLGPATRAGLRWLLIRITGVLWIGWDGTMLTAAVAHGAAGTWAVTRDHLRRGPGRTAAAIALAAISLALAGLGWYTIVAVVQAALTTR